VVHKVPGIGGMLAAIAPTLLNVLAGVVAGALVLACVNTAKNILVKIKKARDSV
jgi:predicted DNA repair protein MutK